MRKAYTSDLTDAQWQLIEPSIPPARTGGRNRTVDMRETVNAIHGGDAFDVICVRPRGEVGERPRIVGLQDDREATAKQDEEGVFAEGMHDKGRQMVWEALFSYTTLSQNRLTVYQEKCIEA